MIINYVCLVLDIYHLSLHQAKKIYDHRFWIEPFECLVCHVNPNSYKKSKAIIHTHGFILR